MSSSLTLGTIFGKLQTLAEGKAPLSSPTLDGPSVILTESCMSERLISAPIASTRFWGYRAVCCFYIENKMYRVVCEEEEIEVVDLQSAMDVAKTLDRFVSIFGNGVEIVGRFGIDTVRNGVCPDGVEYTWRKRR